MPFESVLCKYGYLRKTRYGSSLYLSSAAKHDNCCLLLTICPAPLCFCCCCSRHVEVEQRLIVISDLPELVAALAAQTLDGTMKTVNLLFKFCWQFLAGARALSERWLMPFHEVRNPAPVGFDACLR